MSINEILSKIQTELKVPKGRNNGFLKSKYRNAEDILEEFKKIKPDGVSVVLNDDIVIVGKRYYIKSTAVFRCGDEEIESSAFAREPLEKKGLDESQVTGSTSSYARKYALSGLFCLDDSVDADSFDNKKPEFRPEASRVPAKIAPKSLVDLLISIADNFGASEEQRKKWLDHFKVNRFSELSETDAKRLIAIIQDKMNKAIDNAKPGDIGKPSNFVNGG